MTRVAIGAIGLGTLLALAAGGWWWWRGETLSAQGSTHIDGWTSLGPLAFDFGVVDLPDETPVSLRHRFELRNDSGSTRRILSTTTSCSCVEAEPSESEIVAKATLAVDVVLTLRLSGHRSGTVFLRDDTGAVIQARVVATGRRPGILAVTPLPAHLLDDAEFTELHLDLVLHPELPIPGPPIVSSEPRLIVEFGDWTEGLPAAGDAPTRRFSGLLKLMRGPEGWPATVRISVEGADPVELELGAPEG
ncbi:MAG TPA: hypothetical protein PKC43_13425 [Phycisphaerales bacterium]|nr:hypothetical protein [Phycisphaerales bacterium]HMP38433.1 hypothetical protein [Phycisphaerales bacterium]